MKYSFFLLLNVVISTCVFSQEKISYEFAGALTPSDKQSITYKIYFEVLENGKIEGVSTTDFFGSNITKSDIVGTLDQKKHILSFHETSNISTKSTEDDSIFCFVQIESLKIRTVKDKMMISGPFSGKYSDGEECATGTIYLVTTDVIKDLKEMISKMNIGKDTLERIDSILTIASTTDEAELLNEETPIVKTLTSNDKLSTNWEGDQIVFDVWDGNKEDSDVINIYFNDELIKENLVIVNDKQTIVIPFKENVATIRVLAIDEGLRSPNTVNFVLKNGNNLNPFISKLRKGEEVRIEFKRND